MKTECGVLRLRLRARRRACARAGCGGYVACCDVVNRARKGGQDTGAARGEGDSFAPLGGDDRRERAANGCRRI